MDLTTFWLLFTLSLLLIMAFATCWWCVWMLWPLLHRGGPYVPSSGEAVATMLRLAELKPEDVITDLGSGDGRIVVAAAKAGVKEAVGYEIHPGLVRMSQALAKVSGVSATAKFVRSSFWKADFSKFSVVFLYQVPYAMDDLEPKLIKDLPVGARVVSNGFRFKTWIPVKDEEHVRVYVKAK